MADKPKLTLEDFEAMKNSKGMVPMIVTVAHAPYAQNAIAGFTPKVALAEYIGGRAIPQAMKDKIPATKARTEDPPKPKGSLGVNTQTLPRQLGTKRTDQPDLQEVPIPENWNTKAFGHLNRIRVAKRISGKTKESGMKDAEAIQIIEAELAKRTAK